MTPINREFLVNLTQPPVVIEDLLPKSLRVLIGVDFLTINCAPTAPACNDPSIKTPAVSQILPLRDT